MTLLPTFFRAPVTVVDALASADVTAAQAVAGSAATDAQVRAFGAVYAVTEPWTVPAGSLVLVSAAALIQSNAADQVIAGFAVCFDQSSSAGVIAPSFNFDFATGGANAALLQLSSLGTQVESVAPVEMTIYPFAFSAGGTGGTITGIPADPNQATTQNLSFTCLTL